MLRAHRCRRAPPLHAPFPPAGLGATLTVAWDRKRREPHCAFRAEWRREERKGEGKRRGAGLSSLTPAARDISERIKLLEIGHKLRSFNDILSNG